MPDVGRFFNVDPLAEKFSYNGVYNFSENRVINARELEGLEAVDTNGSGALFYKEFSNFVLSVAGKIDNFFREATTSLPISSQKVEYGTKAYKVESESSVKFVRSEKTQPNLKNYLKTSLYNQQHPEKPQKMDKIIKTTKESYVKTSNETKLTVTSEYGQTTIATDVSSTSNDQKVKTEVSVTQGVDGNGAYLSTSSDGTTQVGVKGHLKVGSSETEVKIGYEKKGN